jgi:hypothetical protein
MAELKAAAEGAKQRIDQIEFQSRQVLSDLQRTDITQAMAARRQIEAEKRRHEALRQDIVRQLQEAEKLEIGAEFERGTVEGSVEVGEGDDLLKKLGGTEIVIKDGVIIEVREA